jgi:hypothetical protein
MRSGLVAAKELPQSLLPDLAKAKVSDPTRWAERDSLAERILRSLSAVVPGSVALLRGSLAEGRADIYSDIDVLWEVSDAHFKSAIEQVNGLLMAVHPIESWRSDPDFSVQANGVSSSYASPTWRCFGAWTSTWPHLSGATSSMTRTIRMRLVPIGLARRAR